MIICFLFELNLLIQFCIVVQLVYFSFIINCIIFIKKIIIAFIFH